MKVLPVYRSVKVVEQFWVLIFTEVDPTVTVTSWPSIKGFLVEVGFTLEKLYIFAWPTSILSMNTCSQTALSLSQLE